MTRWNIAVGKFFFRYRNIIFPMLFSLVLPLGLRPHIFFGDPAMDRSLVLAGAAVALLGEAVRLTTIGYEYIERGGKNKQVWASKLVQGGIYAHSRNPMYVGNLLIALGLCMAAGATAGYLVILPLFVFIYQAIVAAEEQFLRKTFGQEFVAYCARVPRYLPSLHGLSQTLRGLAFDWRRAVRKDLGTITGVLTGLVLLPVWRAYFLQGIDAAKDKAAHAVIAELVILGAYAFLHHLKKHKRFLYLPSELGVE